MIFCNMITLGNDEIQRLEQRIWSRIKSIYQQRRIPNKVDLGNKGRTHPHIYERAFFR